MKTIGTAILALLAITGVLFSKDSLQDSLQQSSITEQQYSLQNGYFSGLTMRKSDFKAKMNLVKRQDNEETTQIFDIQFVNGYKNVITISYNDNYFQAYKFSENLTFVDFKENLDELNQHDIKKRYWEIKETVNGISLKNLFYQQYLGTLMLIDEKRLTRSNYWAFIPYSE